jgi:hypothetical protein
MSDRRRLEIDRILNEGWQAAARANCMLLINLNPDRAFDHLREMIEDCLAKGLSAADTQEHVVKELLQAAASKRKPSSSCKTIDQRGQSR